MILSSKIIATSYKMQLLQSRHLERKINKIRDRELGSRAAHLPPSCPDATDSLSNRSKVMRIRVRKSGRTDLWFNKQLNNFDENWGKKRTHRLLLRVWNATVVSMLTDGGDPLGCRQNLGRMNPSGILEKNKQRWILRVRPSLAGTRAKPNAVSMSLAAVTTWDEWIHEGRTKKEESCEGAANLVGTGAQPRWQINVLLQRY
jgi:hypothetical protein